MNLRDLKYLMALADHRHFGKAAQACFVSQPALSMQIKKLEKYLGVQLLERTNKSVTLTDAGMILAERARLILQQTEEMREIAKSSKDLYSGEIKIGIFPTLAPYLLPHIIPELKKTFPKLSIYLIEEQTAFLLEKLNHTKLDTAILSLPADTNFNVFPLFEEEFVLAVPEHHALAKRKVINQNDLENQSLLLLEDGHCMREQALNLCSKVNAEETKTFRATSLETLRHMIVAGMGITLMPKLACQTKDNISYIPFAAPKPSRTIGMLWRKSTAKEKLLIDIAGNIKKILMKQSIIKII